MFKIQLIGEQPMQVPNWQYHSKRQNTQMSVFEGCISLYFLHFINANQHWILKDSSTFLQV